MKKMVYSYYALSKGIEPKIEDYNRTLATAKYLEDNGFNKSEIIKIFTLINKEVITGEDLPEMLWENSLLTKDKFYYSDILHIKSKPPTWDPVTFTEKSEPFFLEMKINFTMNNLLEYYYDKCRVPQGLQNDKKNSGALLHLIKKYNAFNNVPGLDYVIALINKASQDVDNNFVCDIFEIEVYAKEVIEDFESMYQQSVFEQTNKVIWRN